MRFLAELYNSFVIGKSNLLGFANKLVGIAHSSFDCCDLDSDADGIKQISPEVGDFLIYSLMGILPYVGLVLV